MITKILQKYDGFTNYWYPDLKEPTIYTCKEELADDEKTCKEKEKHLFDKYKKYIPRGWYGFSLGLVPPAWYDIIDDFLTYLTKLELEGKIKGFEIHQIKLKFGGLRFYVSFCCDDDEIREFVNLQISKLENHLFDEKLIY